MKIQIILLANLFVVVTMMFLLLLNSVEGGSDVQCRENERRALLEFKAGVVDHDGILSSWNNKSHECCKWRGIRCSNFTGHVNNLSLPAYFDWNGLLMGKISPSLGDLRHLKYLDLSYNFFDGEIPPQLGNLSNLRSLDLRYTFGLKVQNLEWISRLQLLTHLAFRGLNLSSCNNWLNQIYKLSSLTHLHLSDCNLPDQFGVLNTSFSAFNSLVVADLSYNHFVSPKSYNWLFNFTTTLVSLDLSLTSFQRSEIPTQIGRIISLGSLSLDYCKLEGMLPDSFSNLTHLATLSLWGNKFNGSLSDFLRPLATKEKNSLEDLWLSDNQFDGSLPDYFPRFPYLQGIWISYNKLNGSFPANFWHVFSSLVDLDLSHNQITGKLPNLTLFSSLEHLTLSKNKLEGTIPETYLSNLSKLVTLDLSFNSLSLKTSVYWVPPFQLDQILLDNCTLGPHFPSWLQSQRKISRLTISSSGISDTIPFWFWDLLPRVEYLNISHNNLQGTVPDLSFMAVLDAFFMVIDMSFNDLTGSIPRLPINIAFLDLSQNMFNGSLSFLYTSSYKSFESIRLSDNQLSGELPDCWINVPRLRELNLANNRLSGKLPSSMGLLNEVRILQFRNNTLIGELPSSLMNCSELQLLDLSENEFSGEVPKWIGTHLTSLIILSLGKNKFFGKIPLQICLLTHVQVVDLSRNQLSRSIPNCINNFSALVQTENYNLSNELYFSFASTGDNEFTTVPIAYVQWKGQESFYGHTLGLLKLIDFSSNILVGEIPKEVGSLKGLMSLNLSNNNLNGNIIPNIGHMNRLEVLDLSENNLSGEIPAGLSNLTFLSVLDLSENKLKGRIPSSTQLRTFGPSSYAGNEKLCGIPLPDCANNRTKVFSSTGAHGNDEHNEDYEDTFITMWFYISLVLGFITGFWGFLGPVLLRSTWRHAYSRFLENITDWIYLTASLSMARLRRKIYG